ncbi:MAG: hypothetical protein WC314_08280 [Vulcanimicrobiota bacterium]
MIEVYYWQDDPEAEELLELLEKRGLEYRAIQLDVEDPGSRPSATYQGKTYWELGELLRVLEEN